MLPLTKPLSKNNQQFRSAKVSHPMCRSRNRQFVTQNYGYLATLLTLFENEPRFQFVCGDKRK